MRAATYARYSSENQSEKSIDDQIRVCKNYIKDHGMTLNDDENSKLGIHIRGLINELYLDDLRKKTMRGLEGQKIRGFSTGENVYEYYTQPVGELKLNKKGQPKYEGMIHQKLADPVATNSNHW